MKKEFCECGEPATVTKSSGRQCKRCADSEKLNDVIASQVIVGFKEKQPKGNPTFWNRPKEEEDFTPIVGGSLKYLKIC